jgi:crossover junction endodeoxyribonuclease RuvC
MFDPDGPVLGIDPGLSRCGYGAVTRRDPGSVRPAGSMGAVAYGNLTTSRDEPLPERLAALEADLEALMAELRPSALAVERVLFQANVRTAMTVGQASGLALAVAARNRIPVTQYSPNEVKQAITGDGAANKAQVQAMVVRLLALPAAPGPDPADALALALCHAWMAPLREAQQAGAPPVRGAGSDGRPNGDPSRAWERAVTAALARDGAR